MLNIGDTFYLSIDGGISKHILRGNLIKNDKNFYIFVSAGRDTVATEEQVFDTLEEAKQVAIECHKNKIEDITKLIEEIETTDNIEYVSEDITQ